VQDSKGEVQILIAAWCFVDSDDMNLLTAEISASSPPDLAFDLSGDRNVDRADLEKWLSDAATLDGFAQPYLSGDSNLDGSVAARDLNNLALNWQESIAAAPSTAASGPVYRFLGVPRDRKVASGPSFLAVRRSEKQCLLSMPTR